MQANLHWPFATQTIRRLADEFFDGELVGLDLLADESSGHGHGQLDGGLLQFAQQLALGLPQCASGITQAGQHRLDRGPLG